jgi:hypothetical protein
MSFRRAFGAWNPGFALLINLDTGRGYRRATV